MFYRLRRSVLEFIREQLNAVSPNKVLAHNICGIFYYMFSTFLAVNYLRKLCKCINQTSTVSFLLPDIKKSKHKYVIYLERF